MGLNLTKTINKYCQGDYHDTSMIGVLKQYKPPFYQAIMLGISLKFQVHQDWFVTITEKYGANKRNLVNLVSYFKGQSNLAKKR